MKEICRELNDEYEALDAIVAPLSDEQWNLMTPSIGWNIKYQIAHVAWADMLGRMATGLCHGQLASGAEGLGGRPGSARP